MKANEEEKAGCARGAFFGALVGDAAGSKLEFLGRLPTEQEVDDAMTLPGGGFWRTAPGQITDDGELTLCLADALSKASTFPLDAIARNYVEWHRSGPFDLGQTIDGAFSVDDIGGKHIDRRIQKANAKFGKESKANGSLMRRVPFAIWHRLKDEELAEICT